MNPKLSFLGMGIILFGFIMELINNQRNVFDIFIIASFTLLGVVALMTILWSKERNEYLKK